MKRENTLKYCYELRVYQATEGKIGQLLDRFRNHTLEILVDHRMQSVGYWISEEDTHRLVYIVKHEGDPGENWESFRADERWIKAREESIIDGQITEVISAEMLTPVDFSPLQ